MEKSLTSNIGRAGMQIILWEVMTIRATLTARSNFAHFRDLPNPGNGHSLPPLLGRFGRLTPPPNRHLRDHNWFLPRWQFVGRQVALASTSPGQLTSILCYGGSFSCESILLTKPNLWWMISIPRMEVFNAPGMAKDSMSLDELGEPAVRWTSCRKDKDAISKGWIIM